MASNLPHAELPVGTRVRILMGRCKQVGTVQGWRYANSALTLQRRVVVQLTNGQVKSYLPRKVQALQEPPPCAP